MKIQLWLFFGMVFYTSLYSLNPVIRPGVYLADPAARVFNDGKMYIFSAKDIKPDFMCSESYDVLSSSDLINWQVAENVFASKGTNDEIEYTDNLLYGPDCVFKNGQYLLYYSHQNGGSDVGLAVGNKPVGPFKYAQILKGVNQMLPSIFTDDDGQSYITYGFFSLHVAKLKPSMTEIDTSTILSSLLTEEEHHFHEGGQLFKRQGIYYIVYTQISKRGMATALGYSTSKNVLGPYKYGGVIIDNFGCDPAVWNNLGSVVEFKDNWYVFYHRSTHNSISMRKVCIEPIRFNNDGSISEVEMTTQGVSLPLNPFTKIDAASACYLTGNVRIEQTSPDNEELTHIENLNTASYKYFNFKESPSGVTLKFTPKAGGLIQVYAGNLAKTLLATINIPKGDGVTPLILKTNVTAKVEGVLALHLKFYGAENHDIGQLDWFELE